MLIEYKNVSICHNDDDYVLKGVNLEVYAGDFIYIIGKVGSGKSSLLKTVYGDMDIESADKAEVLGRDLMTVKRKNIQSLRREIGIIFQDFKLLTDRTIRKNLEFILKATGWEDKKNIDQRINEVLSLVQMEGCENKMPHELSGGEQQRIAIARSMLNSPKMILADEPTGNLDPEITDQILYVFKDIAKTGTAVIIATHNMALLEKFPGKVYQCEEQTFSQYEMK